MLNRIKRIVKLSKKDPASLDVLTDEQINDLPDADSKAAFLGSGTEKEYKEQQNKDKFGVKNLFGL
ncbi:MAG: hypothetical protein HN402_07935 [Candidatus Scalindua sp.]|jgi:hypothetical protein|nr:hypothetical protein [Candidatus Scalindua sp.]MBT6757786.1 hypothetical protein [Candidatus Jacksonbacteria bacterium]